MRSRVVGSPASARSFNSPGKLKLVKPVRPQRRNSRRRCRAVTMLVGGELLCDISLAGGVGETHQLYLNYPSGTTLCLGSSASSSRRSWAVLINTTGLVDEGHMPGPQTIPPWIVNRPATISI